MPLPLLPGRWAPRQPLFLFVGPHLLAHPPLVPTWCLRLLPHQGLAQCPLGPQQPSHHHACAEALRLQICYLLVPRASMVVLSLLEVGSPCCSLPRWMQLRAGGLRPYG
jgi:hypothetical protein